MMRQDYSKVEDFLLDDTFTQWVIEESSEEDNFWLCYLEKYPEKAGTINQARDLILSLRIKPVPELSIDEVNQLIERVKNRNPAQMTKFPIMPTYWHTKSNLRFAGMFLVFLLCTWRFYAVNSIQNKKVAQGITINNYREIVNQTAKNILIKLSDNSSVILSPFARLKYPVNFMEKKREVWLSGDAFFEISKNAKRPFFVYANQLTIRVVGTSFAVKANNKAALYRVIVSTGKVSVCAKENKGNTSPACQSILLEPNQQALFYKNRFTLEKETLKQPLLLSEVSAQVHFKFERTPFSKVVSAIEKAYGVSIVYDEKVMGGCLLTASLIDQTLEERLSLVCKAVEANYIIKDGNIVISGNGCN